MTTAELLVLALVLDAALGEPNWIWSRVPHPAVLMGRMVSVLDARLNLGQNRRWKGVLAVSVLICSGLLIGSVLYALGPVATVIAGAILLAQRSLVQHVTAVAKGLRQDLSDGRAAVSMIVSRDTDHMTGPQVARSAIESGSENFSDGVIAPAFWFLLAGPAGLVIYKLINTADSMIGYKTEKYQEFGWAAAKLDDVLNLVPARLSALLIAIAGGVLSQTSAIAKDAALHRSPNAGWPEAAMARALHVALAGPRSYDGEMRSFPWVNSAGTKTADPHAIERCVGLLWRTWALALLLLIALTILF